MKKLILILFFGYSVCAEAQIWSEGFDEANGATTGTATGTPGGTWSVTTTPSDGTFSKNAAGFLVYNTTIDEGVWSTNTFTIASVGYAIISSDILTAGFGFTNADYLRFYYSLDGGPETLFSEVLGTVFSATTNVSAIVAGSTLRIIVRGKSSPVLGFVRFDNVSVVAAPVIYSRKSGTWTDVTGGSGGTGTWSLVSHVGSACGCVPLNTQVAVIGNSNTVTLPVSQTAADPGPNNAPGAVDVESTGILQFNTNGVTLGVQKGLVRVRSGGTINSSSAAITGEQISFNANVGGARLQVDAGGTASFEDLVLAAAATNTHFLEGGGSLTITDDILINANNASLTNNLTTSISVGDDIIFNGNNSDLTNTGTIVFGGDIAANNTDDDGNEVINNTGATLGFVNMDALATGAADGGFLSILNSGTINQTGTFVDIENATDARNDVNNLNGGTWNYSGTGHDTDVRLFANNPTNTFNYNLSGAQQIITPVAGNGYNNLTLQSVAAGAKTALASFSVSGNWSRTGLATFTPGAFTITLNGAAAQSIAAVGGETFNNLTVNNTFAPKPQVTLSNPVTVNGALTMTLGVLSTTSTNVLTIISGGTSSGGNANSYVDGPMKKIGNSNFIFPLGSGGYWARLQILPTGGGVATTFTAQYFVGTTPSSSSVSGILRVATGEYWSVAQAGTAITSAQVQLFWESGTRSGITSVTAANLIVASFDGTNWVSTGASATGGTAATGTVRNTTGILPAAINRNFTFGSNVALPTNPLPIELLYFHANVDHNYVNLNWATAQEINNDFFTIEKSANPEVGFEKVGKLAGQGNSTVKQEYFLVDRQPYAGLSYYRLKQTDFDGKFTYSNLVAVNYEGPQFAMLKVYPNPYNARKDQLTIEISGLTGVEEIPVVIFNSLGQKMANQMMKVSEAGSVNENITFESPLTPGVFVIKAGSTVQLTQRLVVE